MSRIIAGSRKGHRLVMPGHDRTRPTSDRVREAAFALIADWAGTAGEPAEVALAGLSFLDLYAGSGAVGLEAASRGAGPVWLVEHDRASAAVARRNAETLRVPATLHQRAVAAVLAGPARSFDIVWADPPYDLTDADLAPVLERIETDWLAPQGLVVVERSARGAAPPWPPGMQDAWQRGYGETMLHFSMSTPA